MNFFKSILSDDPDPPKPDNSDEPNPNSPTKQPQEDPNPNGIAEDGGSADAWSFGGLLKTFATRSESLIETYRKDLEEFGSGLKRETEFIREAASRAVKDLPASLEAGTSAAHGVLDEVLKSTAEIVSKETQASPSDGESETPETNTSSKSGRYSWFQSQLSLIQSDLSSFCDEPEDVEEYKKWKLGFQLEEKRDEIKGLIGENGNLEGIYENVVPNVVDHETFFCRYFYRVDKLKQQDRVRANLVKRAISVEEDDDDELSWDVDDDEGSNNGSKNVKERGDGDKENVVELNDKIIGDSSLSEKEVNYDEKSEKSEEIVEGKTDENAGVSGERKCDVYVKSNNQVTMEEDDDDDDLGWGEIEDIGSGDEEKLSSATQGGRAPLRAKLNVEEDDEDLSWDIEDDDELVKS